MLEDQWKKSSRCESNGCVEVAHDISAQGPTVVIRSSLSPTYRLRFTQQEWFEFIIGVKNGDFD